MLKAVGDRIKAAIDCIDADASLDATNVFLSEEEAEVLLDELPPPSEDWTPIRATMDAFLKHIRSLG
jgi:hypothetical protein